MGNGWLVESGSRRPGPRDLGAPARDQRTSQRSHLARQGAAGASGTERAPDQGPGGVMPVWQSAPFSKKPPKKNPKKPGGKKGKGKDYGKKERRKLPDKVDETLDAPLPCWCPKCGGRGRGSAVPRRASRWSRSSTSMWVLARTAGSRFRDAILSKRAMPSSLQLRRSGRAQWRWRASSRRTSASRTASCSVWLPRGLQPRGEPRRTGAGDLPRRVPGRAHVRGDAGGVAEGSGDHPG